MALALKDFLNKLGIEPNGLAPYEAAFRHPSTNAVEEGKEDYERLEFLGDSLMGLVISHLLYETLPEADQGVLSALKAQYVRTKAEASYARNLGLGEHIVFGPSYQGEINDHILEDVYESFLGALLIDQGLDFAYGFAKKFLKGKICDSSEALDSSSNPKSALQEAFQADHREPVVYKILKEEGPSHKRHFWAAVYFEDEELGRGEGNSKKEAETEAAKDALSKLAVKK